MSSARTTHIHSGFSVVAYLGQATTGELTNHRALINELYAPIDAFTFGEHGQDDADTNGVLQETDLEHSAFSNDLNWSMRARPSWGRPSVVRVETSERVMNPLYQEGSDVEALYASAIELGFEGGADMEDLYGEIGSNASGSGDSGTALLPSSKSNAEYMEIGARSPVGVTVASTAGYFDIAAKPPLSEDAASLDVGFGGLGASKQDQYLTVRTDDAESDYMQVSLSNQGENRAPTGASAAYFSMGSQLSVPDADYLISTDLYATTPSESSGGESSSLGSSEHSP